MGRFFTHFLIMNMRLLKFLPVLAIMAMLAVACSNDEDTPVPATYQLRAADGRTITVTTAVQQYTDENSFIEMLKQEAGDMKLPTRSGTAESEVNAERKTVTGYDEEPFLLNDDVWQKVRFGSWCAQYDLVSGEEYLLNFKRVTKYIPCAYNEMVVADAYLPTDRSMGFNRSGVGYEIDGVSGNDNGKYYAYTLVAVIGYDADGKVVNEHYPCSLEYLCWKYIVLQTE